MNLNNACKLIKKKGLAPLKKSLGDCNTSENLDINTDNTNGFEDDFLDAIFDDIPVNENRQECQDSKDLFKSEPVLIDLDDWDIPKDNSTSPVASIPNPCKSKENVPSTVKTDNGNSKIMNSPKPSFVASNISFAERKQMLFSSREFEEDSTLRLRFLKRDVPASRLKDLKSSSDHIMLANVTQWPQAKNWFVHGVVTEYSELKSASGARIEVNDLAAEPFSISVLLFGSAHTSNLKKIPVGTIVCILNPTKGKPYKGNCPLVVNNESQLILAGSSRDYGLCGASTKSGGHCRNVVNMNICRYCRFHAVHEYKKQKMSKDIRAASKGVGIKTTDTALWNAPADRAKYLTPGKQNLTLAQKDKNRLARLDCKSQNKKSDVRCLSNVIKTDVSAVLKRKSDTVEDNTNSAQNDNFKKFAPSYGQVRTNPCLSPVQSKISSSPRLSKAKHKALEFARNNGGVITPKPKPKVETSEEIKSEEKKDWASLISPEFLALKATGSLNPKLAEKAEADERNKRFDRLQVIEEVGEKLVATHEVPTRAIRCLVCSKTFHQLPLQCVMNQHKSSIVMGTKRFFQCAGCKTRTTTLERFPSAECSTCRTWSWKRAGMAAEKICTAVAPLSVRGLEETFLGSAVSDANLSMLVPEGKID